MQEVDHMNDDLNDRKSYENERSDLGLPEYVGHHDPEGDRRQHDREGKPDQVIRERSVVAACIAMNIVGAVVAILMIIKGTVLGVGVRDGVQLGLSAHVRRTPIR